MAARPQRKPERPAKIRAFIAVELPDALKAALGEVQEAFRTARGRMKWVRPAGMHLTLKFLGDVEEGLVPEIGRRIEMACDGRKAFPVHFYGTGVFPDLRRPRVLWIGVKEGAEALIETATALDPLLREIGFPEETRPFRPHLTLARIKEIGDRQGFKALVAQHREIDAGTMTANGVHLVESRLRPDGAVYKTRLTVDLLEQNQV
jgi:2'-5' RNA ligase